MFVFNSALAADKDIKTKVIELGEQLKVEINANYHISNIQWFKDGVAIPGATERQYMVKNSKLSDQGVYHASMLGPCREIESTPLYVRINYVPQASVETASAGGNALFQNEPNPAADIVKFKFNLDKNSNVRLVISDLFGNQVATVFDGMATEGMNVVEFKIYDKNISSGNYFYSIISDNFTDTKSMIILK